MLNKNDFDLLKSRQYCDNPECSCYNKVDAGNIRINSRPKGQVYCKECKNIWVVTKGTILFGLKTPIDKVIDTLQMLARGMGLRNTCRQQNITVDSALSWIEKAAEQVNGFTQYMQQEMHLEQAQIDEFWSFIRKKRKILQMKRNAQVN